MNFLGKVTILLVSFFQGRYFFCFQSRNLTIIEERLEIGRNRSGGINSFQPEPYCRPIPTKAPKIPNIIESIARIH